MLSQDELTSVLLRCYTGMTVSPMLWLSKLQSKVLDTATLKNVILLDFTSCTDRVVNFYTMTVLEKV